MYPAARVDADGQPLDGSKHDYTLTFPAGQMPPVNAFWSVTMYDGKTQLLIKNPIDRYLINSPMLPNLKRNADGSLTIYIQNKSPGPDKEATGCPRRTVRSTSSCASTGRRRRRRRSCRRARAPGSRRASSARDAVATFTTRRATSMKIPTLVAGGALAAAIDGRATAMALAK